MSAWISSFTSEEIKELQEAYRENFRDGNIDEGTFRRNMARLGLNSTEIDSEVKENQPL